MEIVLIAFVAIVVLGIVFAVVVRGRRGAPPGRARPTRPGSTPLEPTRPGTSPTPRPVSDSGVGTAVAATTLAPTAVKEGLGSKIRQLLGTAPTRDAWHELEAVLVRADVGARAAGDLVERVKARFDGATDPVVLVREEIVALLGTDTILDLPTDRLAIVMVVGVNGAGKSTTIGKLAAKLGRDGKQVTLANSDTFRAAAGEQLGVWADRAGATLVAQNRGADPGSVAFDAVTSATAKGADVLIVDTAGRLHTKTPLMDELAKVRRVTEKAGGTVDETLLVLDAQTGQNGIAQARAFTDAVKVTGVVLTKMDGSARGGIVLAVREELGVPVKLVGVGESIDDLETFDSGAFADGLLGA
ncbi:MAG: signal recognition particle-docking protein FtsY [Actinomycetota bacterium]